MKLILEIDDEVTQKPEKASDPVGDWNVAVLGNHGILLSRNGFSVKLDVDQLNKFFDYVMSGRTGEIKDHDGHVVLVEPTDDGVVLSRSQDAIFPNGVLIDLATLKLIGVTKRTEVQSNDSVDPDENAQSDLGPSGDDPDDVLAAIEQNDKMKKGIKESKGQGPCYSVTSIFRKSKAKATGKLVRVHRGAPIDATRDTGRDADDRDKTADQEAAKATGEVQN